ncbi:HNH endonuclease family protein [Pseudonocardia sp. HH130630-07]|uniref:HNH endonuclease family protein n=1 Tax=Pseudonocardia sp. HH130630-07 TaxID=1690815 RepID=UPI000814F13D|nr:HNH endonuclease family protein [Pseudonocardia sp. HH130630-07]ANY10635.1 hypothetical protein AFB00_29965 [Pseudonocardia sp. HH130630-07]
MVTARPSARITASVTLTTAVLAAALLTAPHTETGATTTAPGAPPAAELITHTTDVPAGAGRGVPATELLAELVVRDDAAGAPGYDRDAFGASGWGDLDGDGCATRDEVLARDLTDVELDRDDCTVLSGTLDDPYTGDTIAFTRGRDTSDDVQIDHVVALADAWRAGADRLTDDERLALANDPANLAAVDGPTNNAKGDRTAERWLPPAAAAHCTYATTQIEIKTDYQLSVTRPEHDALAAALSSCTTPAIPDAAPAAPAPDQDTEISGPADGGLRPGTHVELDMPLVGRIVVTVGPDGVPALTTPGA